MANGSGAAVANSTAMTASSSLQVIGGGVDAVFNDCSNAIKKAITDVSVW